MSEKIKKDSIIYKGKVNIKVLSNKTKKPISSKTIHNTGRSNLFLFLVKSLMGSYSECETLRPQFINCFNIGEVGDPVPSWNNFDEIANAANEINLIPIRYNGDPIIIPEEESYSISFKFLIPFTQLNFGDRDDINMIALYAPVYKNILDQASNYIIIKDNNNELSGILKELGIDKNIKMNDYNLFIEWILSFENGKGE